MLQSAPRFVFTNFVAISHVTITTEESETVLYGLYTELATNEMKDVVIQCDFAKLNDLLSVADFDEDKAIVKLSNVIAAGADEPATIDVAEDGGLNFIDVFICLEPVTYDHEDEREQGNNLPSYYLHSFIKNEDAVSGVERSLPHEPRAQIDFYLYALTIRYRFYLHFLQQNEDDESARHYASLEDDIVFQLAKTTYELHSVSKP